MRGKFTFYQKFMEMSTRKRNITLLLALVFGIQNYAPIYAANSAGGVKKSAHPGSVKDTSLTGEKVISFTLINADTNEPIQTMTNGDTLVLSNLPTRNLSVRANTYPATVGSINFKLTGTQIHEQAQTVKPYALFGDSGGNYYPWVPTIGGYRLTCTPYSGPHRTGTAGTALTVSFTVVNQTSTNLISNIKSNTKNSYAKSNLAVGANFYTDRTYKITSVPSSLNGEAFIKTPNNDKSVTSSTAFTFQLGQSATIYVAYDPLAAKLPGWMSGWRKLSDRIGINDPRISYLEVYSKTFAAGTVTLGGNLASPATGSKNTYMVVVKPSGVTNVRPYVTAVRPTYDATNVPLDQSISVDLKYPGGNYIRTSTVNTSTAKLFVVSSTGTKTQVTGTVVNSTAAGDAITLSAPLKANTSYEFRITSGVKDDNGNALVVFASRFNTTSETPDNSGDLSGVSFTEKTLITTSFGSDGFTSLVVGPDHRLYAATSGGKIERWDIRADGTIFNHVSISPFGSTRRLLIGFHFAPTATSSNLIAWISHSSPVFTGAPEWSGKISRIDLNNPSSPQVVDYVINLPRSYKDHSTNSIDFGPDGALYFPQGSNSAMGSLDGAWGNRWEKLLSGAILRLDIAKAQQYGLPVDVKTQEGGNYNPKATNAPLTIYATGVRNAYDLVWHSTGKLYVPNNGSAAGGNTPALASGKTWSNGQTYTGPSIPALTDVRQTMNDYLFKIVKGGYYGHPNQLRHEYIMNGGNPTSGIDPGEVTGYKVGTPKEPNYRGIVYSFGLNKSPTGTIEYRSNAFEGKLRGKMLVCRFSGGDDIIVLTPNPTNSSRVTATEGIKVPGFRRPFANPLDVIEDVKTGNLYLSEYYDSNGNGQPQITLLKADKPATSSTVAQRTTTLEDPFAPTGEVTGLTVQVYPNPSPGDKLHTEVQNFAEQETIRLTLHDVVGQVIEATTLVTDEQGAGSIDISLNQHLVRGIYIIKAAGASGSTQTKVVVE